MHRIEKIGGKRYWEELSCALENLEADRGLNFTRAFPFTETMMCPLEKNNHMMEERVRVIERIIPGEPLKLIEIGGAYGNLGKTYLKTHPGATYTLVELKSMLKFAKVFLDVNGVDATLYESAEAREIDDDFDLFMSYAAIPEMSIEYREMILKKFLPRCGSAIIVCDEKSSPEYIGWLKRFYGHCNTLIPPPLSLHSPRLNVYYATRKT